MGASDEQILAELADGAAGLLFMSETDAPFAPVRWTWPGELTPAAVRQLAGHDEGAPVEVMSVDDFFRTATAETEWKNTAALATARRYQALVRVLHEHLSDLRVYRIGRINMPVFIIGHAPSGNWLGLSTRVVET